MKVIIFNSREQYEEYLQKGGITIDGVYHEYDSQNQTFVPEVELPQPTRQDNGKVLSVAANGEYALKTPGYEYCGYSKLEYKDSDADGINLKFVFDEEADWMDDTLLDFGFNEYVFNVILLVSTYYDGDEKIINITIPATPGLCGEPSSSQYVYGETINPNENRGTYGWENSKIASIKVGYTAPNYPGVIHIGNTFPEIANIKNNQAHIILAWAFATRKTNDCFDRLFWVQEDGLPI